METIKPPDAFFGLDRKLPMFFLAGSIEMGKATDWQAKIAELTQDEKGYLLNPRRDDWDPTWKQSIHNEEFKKQVNWELAGLIYCDVILMYLEPGTMSPISLMELGIHIHSKKIVVCCPEGFWRKGNVEIVCANNFIPLVDTLEDLVAEGWRTYNAVMDRRRFPDLRG